MVRLVYLLIPWIQMSLVYAKNQVLYIERASEVRVKAVTVYLTRADRPRRHNTKGLYIRF